MKGKVPAALILALLCLLTGGTAPSAAAVSPRPALTWQPDTERRGPQHSEPRITATFEGSAKTVWPPLAQPGDVLTYTVIIRNPGPPLPDTSMLDPLPAGLDYRGGVQASSGRCGEAGGVITWTGTVSSDPVTITFGVTVSEEISTPRVIVNTAWIVDGLGMPWPQEAAVVVGGYTVYLPWILRE